MVGFNYRRVPAVELARQIIAVGRLGEIRHVRAQYLQEWLVDPAFPLTWRLTQEEAGSGALGDLASHLVDLTTHLLADEITSVSSLLRTFVGERPFPAPRSDPDAVARSPGAHGAVTVDDASLFLAQFSLGGVGSFEATRVAAGNKKAMKIEINGTAGSLRFNVERLNELELFEGGDDAGFRTILVTEPRHPWMSGWPAGHVIGWEHTFVHQARDLLTAIGEDRDVFPDFGDGLQTQRVLAAVETAHRSRRWEPV
jgi:predicted dehydrogenase